MRSCDEAVVSYRIVSHRHGSRFAIRRTASSRRRKTAICAPLYICHRMAEFVCREMAIAAKLHVLILPVISLADVDCAGEPMHTSTGIAEESHGEES